MKRLTPYVLAFLMLAPLRLFAGNEDFEVKLVDVLCYCSYDPESSSYYESDNPAMLARAEEELFIKCVRFLSNGKAELIGRTVKAVNQTALGCSDEAAEKKATKLKSTASLQEKLPKRPKVNIEKLATCGCVGSGELQDQEPL
jgi:hypothetical protein